MLNLVGDDQFGEDTFFAAQLKIYTTLQWWGGFVSCVRANISQGEKSFLGPTTIGAPLTPGARLADEVDLGRTKEVTGEISCDHILRRSLSRSCPRSVVILRYPLE